MINIAGYKVSNELYSGNHTIIYKAIRESDNTPVIIKLLKSEYPTPDELKKFKYQYDMVKSLDHDGIVVNYDLVKYNNTQAIVMEDFGGSSVEQIIRSNGPIPLHSFLHIAIKLSKALGYIHKNNIIHKDIKPHNVIYNSETGIAKIIDFGISSKLSKEVKKATNTDNLEGTLSYISPEQTGRMNKAIDYRTDFYSLGISFYEMLTGNLPFKSDDPMEIVHSHIAVMPKAPHEIKNNIPLTLSSIIMKLISKNADDRYKSAYGLRNDLERCLDIYNEKGTITDFKIAENDISDRLQVPDKLYGREKELNLFTELFDKTASGSKEIVTFAGEAGSGKSSIIKRLQRHITANKGYLAYGKFDEYRTNIPYLAIIEAFQTLAKSLLLENDDDLKNWKDKILAAVGNNGGVITKIIPEFELIIGEQPAIPELGAAESQNRFNLVFQNFIKVFASSDHPFVFYIDDMQISDNASLKLLETILSNDDLTNFMFIGSYRSNEINKDHILLSFINKLSSLNLNVTDIMLNPLTIESTTEMLSDTFYCNKNIVHELSEIVHIKSGGNPFYIQEYLKKLCDDSLIVFDNGWKWDINKIKQTKISDNIVEIMIEKVKSLPEDALEVLRLISCMGSSGKISLLSELLKIDTDEIDQRLGECINNGFIIKLEDEYKFAHNKIRDSIYSDIEQSIKEKNHYAIGKSLLSSIDIDNIEDSIFDIVSQLNLAINEMDEYEKKELIELNYTAGIKAKKTAAYDSAVSSFEFARNELPTDSWDSMHDLTFQVYIQLIESLFLSGMLEYSDELLNRTLKYTTLTEEKVKLNTLRITQLVVQARYKEVLELGINTLSLMGIDLPQYDDKDKIKSYYTNEFNWLNNNWSFSSAESIELVEDDDLLNIMTVIKKMLQASMISFPDFNYFLIIFLVNYSIKNGFTRYSLIGLSRLAVVMAASIEDYDKALSIFNITKLLVEKYPDPENLCQILVGFGSYLPGHFNRDIDSQIKLLKESYQIGLDNGDITYASYSISHSILYMGTKSDNIQSALDNMENTLEMLNKLNKPIYLCHLSWIKPLFLYLSGKTSIDNPFYYDNYDSDSEFLSKFSKAPLLKSLFDYTRIFGLVIMEEYEKAEIYINNLSIKPFSMYINSIEARFYTCLYYTSIFDKFTNDEQKNIKKILLEHESYFEKIYPYLSEIILGHYYLVKAEITRVVNNDYNNAQILYDKAIFAAKQTGFIHIEAISNEFAGRYYLHAGLDKIAKMYLIEAKYCFSQWGAIAKVEQLEEKYSKYFSLSSVENIKDPSMTTSTTTSSSSLDISTVMKASQTIASEIEMDKLLSKMLTILIENAGAQKGALILIKDEKLFIEAECEVNKAPTNVLKSILLDKSDSVPKNVVRFTVKTGDSLVCDNISADERYNNDQYVIQNNAKSVLCSPIIGQGKIIGAVYLENNISEGAFTANRVEILKVLSSQAAISIENARLIDGMKEKARLQQEMAIAQKIQTSLVPVPPEHEELEIVAVMRPAEEVGGDYYDIVIDEDNKTWFAIGDVSGHGVTPGLVMMMAQTSFNTKIKASSGATPRDAITIVNHILNENVRNRLKETHFMTMSFMKYNGNGDFLYSGSHLDIVVYRATTKKTEIFKTRGIYLAILPDIKEITEDDSFHLDPNDFVVVYTDGVIESRETGNRTNLWGMDNLCKVIEDSAEGGPEAVKESIVKGALEWCNYEPDDDITLMVIKRK